MATMLALGIALGICLGAVLWDVIFCDPLRRDNDELRLQAVRRNLRAAGDRMGYVEYRLQHRGTPLLRETVEDARRRAVLEVLERDAGWPIAWNYHWSDGSMRSYPEDKLDHSKSSELRAV